VAQSREDYNLMLTQAKRNQKKNNGTFSVRLAVIAGTDGNGLFTVRFDGDEASSGKGYPAILTGYTLTEGDRVACVRVRGSYIILGKLQEVR